MLGILKTKVEPSEDKANKISDWIQESIESKDGGTKEVKVEILGQEYEIRFLVEVRRSRIPFSTFLGIDHDVRGEVHSDEILIAERNFGGAVPAEDIREWLLSVHRLVSVQDVNIT